MKLFSGISIAQHNGAFVVSLSAAEARALFREKGKGTLYLKSAVGLCEVEGL